MRYFIRGEYVECATQQEYRDVFTGIKGATEWDVQYKRGLKPLIEHVFDSYDWPETTAWLVKFAEPFDLSSEAKCKDFADNIYSLFPVMFFERLEEIGKLKARIAWMKREQLETAGKMLKKLSVAQKQIEKQKLRAIRAKIRRRR